LQKPYRRRPRSSTRLTHRQTAPTHRTLGVLDIEYGHLTRA
jgi:hypothetical protein